MLRVLIFFIISGVFSSIKAQDTTQENKQKSDTLKYWKFDGITNINFSQVGLKNWAGGGQESISITGLQRLTLNYDNEKDESWKSVLELNYGLIKQGDMDEFRKSDDQLLFSSKYDRKIAKNLNLSALLDFRTQFDKGFNFVSSKNDPGEDSAVLISQFMAPAYVVASIGFEYKPIKEMFFMLSPVAGKSTFVLNDSLSDKGAYGVPEGKRVRQEFGINFTNSISWTIMENVNFESNLNLFGNYKTPFEIDLNWEGGLQMKVNEFITASITSRMIYDEDILIKKDNEEGPGKPRLQFKEVIALGINYKY